MVQTRFPAILRKKKDRGGNCGRPSKNAAPLAVLAALALGIFAGRASVLLGDSHIQYGGDAQLVEQPALLLLEEYQVTPLDDPEDHLLIDINTAGEQELCQLPGIGPARAKSIVEYRQRWGPFASVEEIRAVSGIGDQIFENIKDSITVGGAPPEKGNR